MTTYISCAFSSGRTLIYHTEDTVAPGDTVRAPLGTGFRDLQVQAIVKAPPFQTKEARKV